MLASMPLDAAQTQMFTDWVNGGGILIAMRPDAALGLARGARPARRHARRGLPRGRHDDRLPARASSRDTIQFHGTADRYALTGRPPSRRCTRDATTATTNPAVTMRPSAQRRAAAVSPTTSRVRSSRPARATRRGRARSATARSIPIRSDDLFYGAAADDPQTDWVNLDKVQIPQADEQQRLLVNLIETHGGVEPAAATSGTSRDDAKAVVVMTERRPRNGGTAGRFDTYLADSAPGCSVDDWECIRASAYISAATPLTDGAGPGVRGCGLRDRRCT